MNKLMKNGANNGNGPVKSNTAVIFKQKSTAQKSGASNF